MPIEKATYFYSYLITSIILIGLVLIGIIQFDKKKTLAINLFAISSMPLFFVFCYDKLEGIAAIKGLLGSAGIVLAFISIYNFYHPSPTPNYTYTEDPKTTKTS